jgi:hypothetical protein
MEARIVATIYACILVLEDEGVNVIKLLQIVLIVDIVRERWERHSAPRRIANSDHSTDNIRRDRIAWLPRLT